MLRFAGTETVIFPASVDCYCFHVLAHRVLSAEMDIARHTF